MREQKTTLSKKKEELELQTNELNLPFAEARERLLNRIKEDNAEIKQCEREISDLKKLIENYQRNVKDIENDLQSKKDGGEKENQFEVLLKKEREIDTFMDSFEQDKVQYEEQIKKSQDTVSKLLEHMAKQYERQENLPDRDNFNQMKGGLGFKQEELGKAEDTFARLKAELEKRKQDLEKINTLETRIEKEMQQVKEKIDQMEDDMQNKFTRVDEMKDKFDREKIRLAALKQLLVAQKPALQNLMAYHSMKHDTKSNQITQNEVYIRLNDLERKLIKNESDIYAIQTFIEGKGAENDYQVNQQQCLHLLNEINNQLIKKSLTVGK